MLHDIKAHISYPKFENGQLKSAVVSDSVARTVMLSCFLAANASEIEFLLAGSSQDSEGSPASIRRAAVVLTLQSGNSHAGRLTRWWG